MLNDFRELLPIFSNVVMPLLAGLIFFAMAKYVHHIAPLRTLITGELTYRGAYWGFLFLGVYLASRPIQILFPHPWPLIVNNVREFLMIAVFGPAVFLAMASLVFGTENIPRRLIVLVLALGVLLAGVFVVTNSFVIGGSEPLFKVGRWTAHDGLWFKNPDLNRRAFMRILFAVRIIDPVLLVFLAGSLVLWHAKNYPVEKRVLYDNMPIKLYLLGAATYTFSLTMLLVGLIFLMAHIPNQWWIYYLGALAAGFLETLSLALPMRKHVQVSEHL
ncbi:MAG: hypothetical protein IPP68_05910 [Elusimicrobia bacterium]|nr:hypothetical protein [Elusimicrobiota bacterium]